MSYDSFSIDVNLTEGAVHQLSIYASDYDNKMRSQHMEMVDGANDAVLDSRDLAPVGDGQYLVWNVRGHVILRVTNTSSQGNALVQGVFLR